MLTKNIYRTSALAILVFGLFLSVIIPPTYAQVSSKKKLTYIYSTSGACSDNVFTQQEFDEGKKCIISVRVKQKGKRTVKIQWWSNEDLMWKPDTQKKTNKSGLAKISMTPICASGDFCDGYYFFRVVVPKSGKYAAAKPSAANDEKYNGIMILFEPYTED